MKLSKEKIKEIAVQRLANPNSCTIKGSELEIKYQKKVIAFWESQFICGLTGERKIDIAKKEIKIQEEMIVIMSNSLKVAM